MIETQALRQALVSSGNSWLLNYWGADRDRFLEAAARDLDAFVEEYAKRFGENPDPLSMADSPFKGKAFFQPDTLRASVDMKIMVWRILLGCEVARIHLEYAAGGLTRLTVELRTPYGETETYIGRPGDFRLLRHFGVIERNGELVVQGYYALK